MDDQPPRIVMSFSDDPHDSENDRPPTEHTVQLSGPVVPVAAMMRAETDTQPVRVQPDPDQPNSAGRDGFVRKHVSLAATLIALLVVALLVGTLLLTRHSPRSNHSGDVSHQSVPTTTSPLTTATIPPATSITMPTTTSTEAESPPAVVDYNVGDPFKSECLVAWPSAPVVTSQDIQMTMTCDGVPTQYLFTQVIYGDPHLDVTPQTGQMEVTGRIIEIATSELGFKELVVEASRVDL